MKIKSLDNRTQPQPWMCYPSWLWEDGHPCKELFHNEESAKEYYTLFFMASNPQCQIEIFQQLVKRLAHAESIYNPYNYDVNSLKYAKETIEHQLKLWKKNYSILFNNIPATILDEVVLCYYVPEQEIAIKGTTCATAMSDGELKADFLVNHPGTEIQFNRYILAKIMHDTAGVTKGT